MKQINDDTFSPLNPLSPLSPANPASPYSIWNDNESSVKIQTIDSNVCACLPANVCRNLDDHGNHNGIPENVDIPRDVKEFEKFLGMNNMTVTQFNDCVLRFQNTDETTVELTKLDRTVMAAAMGGLFGIIIAVAAGELFGFSLLTLGLPIVAGIVAGGLLAYLLLPPDETSDVSSNLYIEPLVKENN